MRQTGEPYVAHCVETARILAALLPPSGGPHAEAAVVAAVRLQPPSFSFSPSCCTLSSFPTSNNSPSLFCLFVFCFFCFGQVLHDVMDDAACTTAELAAAFGSEVADLVAGVSKLSSINQVLRRRRRLNKEVYAEAEASDAERRRQAGGAPGPAEAVSAASGGGGGGGLGGSLGGLPFHPPAPSAPGGPGGSGRSSLLLGGGWGLPFAQG